MSNALTIKSGGVLTVKSAGSLTIKDSGGGPASLIFNLDAADPASYSGTGDVWSDLVGDYDVTFVDVPTWNPSGYFSFNGTSQYGTMPTGGLVYGHNPRSISTWIRVVDPDSTFGWAFSYGSAGFDYCVALGHINAVYYAVARGGALGDVGAAGFPNNTWVNLAFTYDGANTKLFANGNVVASLSSVVWETIEGGAFVGSQVGGVELYNGDIAQLSMYSGALSDAEVLANYNATKDQARFA